MKVKSESNERPLDFELSVLYNSIELTFNENIVEVERYDHMAEKTTTFFEYDTYQFTSHAKTYGDLTKDIIHLKYTYDDEMSATNKGINNPTDETYLKYREWVSFAKQEAQSVYPKLSV